MLKQSTARNVAILMTDSTDHVTGKTGLTLTLTASKDGGAFASITPTVTELSNGWYSLALTATHTNTLGDLLIHATGTGADPSDMREQVVLDLPGVAQTGDSYARIGAAGASLTALGDTRLAHLDADVSTRSTFAGGAVASVTGNVGGNVVGSVASVTARVTANADQLGGQTVTAAAPVTVPTTIASPTNITSASGVALTAAYNAAKTAAQAGDAMTLTAAYDAAKTAAQAGNAMTLTSGERTATAAAIEAAIINDTDGEAVLTAITDKIAAVDPDLGGLSVGAIASAASAAVWAAASRTLTAGTNIVLAKGTGVTGFNDLDAAGVRSAMGLALANLDAQIATLSTYAGGDTAGTTTLLARLTALRAAALDFLDASVSSRLADADYTAPDNAGIAALAALIGTPVADISTDLAAVKTAADGIKAKTDPLTFTVSGKVDANITHVNEVAVVGDGHAGTEWGPA